MHLVIEYRKTPDLKKLFTFSIVLYVWFLMYCLFFYVLQ